MNPAALWLPYHSWVIGGIVVVATSYGRFSTPPTSRSSTTWARYHALACVYTLALATLWIVLANTSDIVQILAADAQLGNDLKSLDAPVYVAVLLTVLPGMPVFGTFDARGRGFLQDLARIPWEAQRLSAALRARTWLPDGHFQDDIRQRLRSADFDEVDMSFSSDRTPQALWTRITALQRYIENWETRQGKFSGFYFANISTVGKLKEEYEDLEAKARRVFPMVKAPKNRGADPSLDPIQQELARSFIDSAERLEKDLCDLVSRGVLTCGLTQRARRAEFETIGFMVNVAPSQLFDNMLGLYLCLAGLYVAVMTIAGRPNPWLTGIVIATNYVAAVLVAFLFKKSKWAMDLPIARYASSAAAAFGFASFISLVLGVLMTFNVQQAWTLTTSRWWPWGLMSAVVAALVGYLLDQEERSGGQWREAGTVALACALFAIPVVWLLNNACQGHNCMAPPLLRVMINAGVTGGLIGFFVPTWYRRPEIMVSEYERFKIVVTLRTEPDNVVATVDVLPPRPSRGPKPSAERLPDEIEDASADDAIAEAIRAARGWIDRQRLQAERRSHDGLSVVTSLPGPVDLDRIGHAA